jgi:hypothetical protein
MNRDRALSSWLVSPDETLNVRHHGKERTIGSDITREKEGFHIQPLDRGRQYLQTAPLDLGYKSPTQFMQEWLCTAHGAKLVA